MNLDAGKHNSAHNIPRKYTIPKDDPKMMYEQPKGRQLYYDILLQDIKEHLNKWRNTPCSWWESLCIIKYQFIPNYINVYNTTITKSPTRYFSNIFSFLLHSCYITFNCIFFISKGQGLWQLRPTIFHPKSTFPTTPFLEWEIVTYQSSRINLWKFSS